jgi:outer membrane protein assembly factor BamB
VTGGLIAAATIAWIARGDAPSLECNDGSAELAGAKITSSAATRRPLHRRLRRPLWALSPRTGATPLGLLRERRIYGTPAVANGRVFVPSSTGGSLTAFSTRGRFLWRVNTGAYVYSSPATSGGRVFFGSYNGLFYAVSASSGRRLWAVGTGGPISGAAVVDGIAYAGSFAHRIVGVDARRAVFWSASATGTMCRCPVTACAYFSTATRLYAVEPRSVRRLPPITDPCGTPKMKARAVGVAAAVALLVPSSHVRRRTRRRARAQGHHASQSQKAG